MEIRKLTNAQEWLESDKLISIAFLHEWDEKEAEAKFVQQESGQIPRREEAWGVFAGENKMVASVTTQRKEYMLHGTEIKVGELKMLGTLPEERGNGCVKELMQTVLYDYKQDGYPFAMLIPFSFAFYRKYGFEVCSNTLKQKLSIQQFAPFKNELRAQMVSDEADVKVVQHLYNHFIQDKNFAYVKTDEDYAYRGNGEYGEPDFFREKNRQYTYLFFDEQNQPKGYLKFIFVHGADGPFVGDMHVLDLVYDSPGTFKSIMGFIYGMRAKLVHVVFATAEDMDFTNFFPEGDNIERTLDSHIMLRVLDVQKVLSMIRTSAAGTFVIRVEDNFMPENTDNYEVTLLNGMTEATKTTKDADAVVSVQTLAQLISGKISWKEAQYREGTAAAANEILLDKVFIKRAISL